MVAEGEGEVLKGEVFLTCEGGITKYEVVAEGEVDVSKCEVHHTSALRDCAKRTTS